MKRAASITLAIALSIQLAACAKSKVIDGVEYKPYGIFNEEQHHNPNIEYELVNGNIVWSIILFETAIAPIYFIGWSIKQPVGKKVPEGQKH
jgi:hypothetical protein